MIVHERRLSDADLAPPPQACLDLQRLAYPADRSWPPAQAGLTVRNEHFAAEACAMIHSGVCSGGAQVDDR
jgi:hypothetical protein